jgi:hypothetical protein
LNDPEATINPMATTKKAIEEPTFWSAFWKMVARNLILPEIGCGLIAIVYTLAVRKATLHPQAVLSATPIPEVPMKVPATQTPAVAFGKTGGSVDTASGSINALGTNHANAVPTPTRDPWQDSPQKALDP